MRNFATRKILIGGLAALSLVLAGCLTDDDGDEGPTITQQPTGQASYAYGDTVTLTVTATGSGTLTFTWLADNDTIGGDAITTVGGTSTLKAVPPASANGAQLKVIVSDAVGSVTSNALTLTLTGLTDWPASTALTVGAQGAVPGSAVDLDSGKVWLSNVANSNRPKIDVVFLYYDSAFTINGAAAARDSGVKYGINLTNGYGTTVVDVKLVAVDAKPGSQQAAEDLYEEAAEQGDAVRAAVIEAGNKFLVKTTDGNYVYLEITSFAGTGSAATSVFTVSLSTL